MWNIRERPSSCYLSRYSCAKPGLRHFPLILFWIKIRSHFSEKLGTRWPVVCPENFPCWVLRCFVLNVTKHSDCYESQTHETSSESENRLMLQEAENKHTLALSAKNGTRCENVMNIQSVDFETDCKSTSHLIIIKCKYNPSQLWVLESEMLKCFTIWVWWVDISSHLYLNCQSKLVHNWKWAGTLEDITEEERGAITHSPSESH